MTRWAVAGRRLWRLVVCAALLAGCAPDGPDAVGGAGEADVAGGDAEVVLGAVLDAGAVGGSGVVLDVGRSGSPEGVFVDVAVSFWSSCAVESSGRLVCWGHVPGPLPEGVFVDVALGWHHGCALSVAGEVSCWGSNRSGQVVAPSGGGFTGVFAAQDSSCALDAAGDAVCWGDAAAHDAAMPAGPFAEMFPSRGWDWGGQESCGLRVSGEVVCWSGRAFADPSDEFAQQMRAQRDQAAAALPVTVSGSRVDCGIDESGSLWCEGSGLFGGSHVPPGVFTSVSVSRGLACALRDDQAVVCWSGTLRPKGAHELGGAPKGRFVHVSVGGSFACALSVDGEAMCWSNDPPRRLIPPRAEFVGVSASASGPCGLTVDDRVVCWDSRTEPPVRDSGLVSASLAQWLGVSCGVDVGEELACWRNNRHSRYWGLPEWEGRFVDVSAYGSHMCAVAVGGALSCVQHPYDGGLYPSDPVHSPPRGEFVSVEVSSYHGCALGVDGSVACWGEDDWRRGYDSGDPPSEWRVDGKDPLPGTYMYLEFD